MNHHEPKQVEGLPQLDPAEPLGECDGEQRDVGVDAGGCGERDAGQDIHATSRRKRAETRFATMLSYLATFYLLTDGSCRASGVQCIAEAVRPRQRRGVKEVSSTGSRE